MMRALAALMLVAASNGVAPAGRSQPTTQVQGLVVVPGPGPAVLSSYPASEASVPGGVIILKIVFNQPMQADAWAYGPSAGADFPKCLADPRLLGDQRTFVLLCTVSANSTFAVEINPAARFAKRP